MRRGGGCHVACAQFWRRLLSEHTLHLLQHMCKVFIAIEAARLDAHSGYMRPGIGHRYPRLPARAASQPDVRPCNEGT